MRQNELFPIEDGWEPCTCPWGVVVGGKDSDNPPTTSPKDCSCEVHRDEWTQQEQDRQDDLARAEWKPNRASRGIEQARVERVGRHGGASQHERDLAAALPAPMAMLLEIAVPGWIERLRLLTPAQFEARRAALTDSMSGPGSALLVCGVRRRMAKKGELAAEFNVLAETLAVLAFQRGGVAWCGLRFEAGDAPGPVVYRAETFPPLGPDALRTDRAEERRREFTYRWDALPVGDDIG